MATYKKRGYKPKTVKEKEEVFDEESTTAEVFNTLDEGASRTEEWAVKNQKYIIGVVAAVAIAVLAYLAYKKLVVEPKQKDAMNEMYTAKKYYDDAVSGVSSDSLYKMALDGGEGKYGMLDIINNYGGTDAANQASYYAGMSYLNLKDYENAIKHLGNFSTEEKITNPMSKGAIGDAFIQLNQLPEGLDYYEKAFKANVNEYTTPLFLMKAARIAIRLEQNQKAFDYLTRITSEFSTSAEAKDAEVLLGMVEVKL